MRRALATLSLIPLLLGLAAQPSWGSNPSAPVVPPYAGDRLIVKFKPGLSAGAKRQTQSDSHLEAEDIPELAQLGVDRFRVPSDQLTTTLAALQQNPLVEYAEPDYRVQATEVITPDDTYWASQWGPSDIQAPQAWAITTGTLSVTIAVIDTGVDLTHPDLASQIDLANSKSFLSYTTSPQDDYGHGTHVAGIAAAIGNNGLGIAGMAWGVRIMALKVLDSSGSGYESDVAAAITYAADHGAQVINLSLGGSASDYTLARAVSAAYDKGVTIVAAAGNIGSPGLPSAGPFYPADYAHVIAVASVDNGNQRSYFSNYGSATALAAPGGNIFSTYPVTFGSYTTLSGTSMATPHVAGVAALLASQPQFNTPDKILAAMENTALDLGTAGWDPYYGYGLVQAASALQYGYGVQISPATAFIFSAAGTEATYPLTVTNSGVFTDSFTLALNAGAAFTSTITPTVISNLAFNASRPVTVTVDLPDATAQGTQEAAQVTVTSQGDATRQASATFTTAVPYVYFFPIIAH